MMNSTKQSISAQKFASFWKDKGYEKGQSQPFWLSLLTDVFGVSHAEQYIRFEEQVKLDRTGFIDGYIADTHVMIEQKALNKDLRTPIRQSDGTLLTPFQQAKRYADELPYSQRPRWIITCNFKEFLVYDMENPHGEPQSILLENFEKEYYRLSFLIDNSNEHLKREMEISLKAGEIVGKLYDELLKQYNDPTDEHSLKSLNMLCVRLVFCLYAEDAGVFGKKSMFHDYISKYDAEDIRETLINLFKVLDTKIEHRDPYLKKELATFPYVNGGLFKEEDIEIPQFTDKIKALLLANASDDFDWSEISPTIFGAVFESTLNPVTRRSGGMHYTSIENIHKVIDPLFLNNLRSELAEIKNTKVSKTQVQKIQDFRTKLANLKFLDPACGSGNFLTETYISLRKLENEALNIIAQGQMQLDFGDVIKVSIAQFYGIEINDFAVTVAKTALWIAENQMMKTTEMIIQSDLDFLPLKSNAHIVEGNALQMDWQYLGDEIDEAQTIVAKKTNLYPPQKEQVLQVGEPTLHYNEINLYTDEIMMVGTPKPCQKVQFDYIMGNPPFVGARLMDGLQKEDLQNVFGKNCQNIGNLDYVGGWYKKAAELMQNTQTHAAFVSTNSITQGEQPAILWKSLMQKGVVINFAYRTFRWDSESTSKAHVHCVIIGFSHIDNTDKVLFINEEQKEQVRNINAYLVDAPNVIVESRSKPLCDVPEIGIGNQPIDNGNYLFTEEEKAEFIQKEPAAAKYFHPWIGAAEFINRLTRYCLWLGDCTPHELRSMPECMKRIKAVHDFRLNSKRKSTLQLADKPTRFQTENMPTENFIVIPETSSEKRKYIPIGFMTPEVLCSNAVRIMPGATLYHFGVLTSNVHNAWMRAVCGRLKSDYRYSKDIVYNNFPWCTPTAEQKAKIEQTAQAVLDARNLYPESSLADLYDELTMPAELRQAHQANDHAVMQAYNFDIKMTENECVVALMTMCRGIV